MDQRLEKSRSEVRLVAERHGARNVRVFGSAVSATADEARDIDLLVEMEPGRSLFDLVDLCDELEQLLGVEVDVLTDDGVSPHLRDRIVEQAVAL